MTKYIFLVALVPRWFRSEEHTSELQSHHDLVCRLLLEKKKKINPMHSAIFSSASSSSPPTIPDLQSHGCLPMPIPPAHRLNDSSAPTRPPYSSSSRLTA